MSVCKRKLFIVTTLWKTLCAQHFFNFFEVCRRKRSFLFTKLFDIFVGFPQIKRGEKNKKPRGQAPISPHWNRVVVVSLFFAYCYRWDFSFWPKKSFTFQSSCVRKQKDSSVSLTCFYLKNSHRGEILDS